ncbi:MULTISPECIES: ABC transporter ATP-binding protein [Rhizobium/Agrobacterium group]|uniref:ABC transporter ATP-binding protein n=1 Tax=Agrobacterium pusense TaxID=648995 RepID=A0AA44EGR8_9HYPH|nr:ABC transporter ATP-binding protein [Agrobacterium pusense]NRF07096.1 ABC transporter ATP-binding protein [Agrobacterium pusense]NRF17960.1 ABC transporter ATP-binding protein [Agrobacterium pusense]
MTVQSPSFVLEATQLVREFYGFRAVNNLDLSIIEGHIHALIGPNGAGKTTVFNLLTKTLSPSSGTIRLRGKDVTRLQPAEVARLGLVRSFQISAIFPSLSVIDNVVVALQRRAGLDTQIWRSRRALKPLVRHAEELIESVGLTRWAARNAGELPYGRKRALEIATTLALSPDVLLLDEPMAGMGREDIDDMTQLIRKVANGKTVVMVEHNLRVVSRLCDRVTVLARGEKLAEGTYSEVSADPRVKEAYMGNGHG